MRTALHIAATVLVFVGLLWACRFVWRRSRFAGVVFAAGLLIRAVAGAFFVAASYFEWPFMRSSQMGGGFWTLAPDAQEYYRLTLAVLNEGAHTITIGYTRPLALFMRAVGAHPAAPVLFALVAYAVAVVTLVAAFGRDRTPAAEQALRLCAAAFTFSPMLIYAGVFGLKDVFTTTLIVIMAVAYGALAGTAWTRETIRKHLPAAAAAAGAIWLLSAIRSYFAVLVWGAMAVACLASVIGARPSRRRAAVQGAVMLTGLGLVMNHGAESRYPEYTVQVVASVAKGVLEQKAPTAHGGLDEFDIRRRAIEDDGGNSVFNRHAGGAVTGRVKGLTLGLAGVFVPVSALEALSIVDIPIRSAARLIADADTLMIDLTAALALWLLYVNRREINPDAGIFAAALIVVVALPMAYVVTNYGLLVRLRLMVAAPIWLLTLALAHGVAPGRAPRQPDPAVTSL